MVLVNQATNEAALLGYHECALSQIDTQPDMTLDVIGREKTPQRKDAEIAKQLYTQRKQAIMHLLRTNYIDRPLMGEHLYDSIRQNFHKTHLHLSGFL